ncbi:hypothetical protein PG985_012939 [Apiospora marii]|uniref:2EXR domain-containing protein n=1 Tax=Apiospora marii TaxID=335849 RepID=A0ABR1RBY7_9PEZI
MADIVAAPTEFHRFGELPKELRLAIWEQAVLEDHRNRIIPFTEDMKRVVLVGSDLLNPSGVLGATPESRGAALGLYDQAIPVVPFFSQAAVSTAIFPTRANLAALHREGQSLDATHDGVSCVHVSYQHDIFLISAALVDFRMNMCPGFRWSNLTVNHVDLWHRAPGPHALPQYMTWAFSPASRARIERVMEIHQSLRPLPPGQPVRHLFDPSEFPSIRQCFHKETVVGRGRETSTRRFVWHLTEGYPNARLLSWLNPDLHTV